MGLTKNILSILFLMLSIVSNSSGRERSSEELINEYNLLKEKANKHVSDKKS